MGNDYAARKSAKKRRSGGGKSGSVDFFADDAPRGKKERPKRAKVRRLCRGHCFQEPVVKAEDKLWPVEEMVEGAESKGPKRSDLPIVIPGTVMRKEPEESEEKPRKRRRTRKSSQSFNLSTDINLRTAKEHKDDAEEKSESTPVEHLPSAALKEFPDAIQRYMAHMRFIEPTPVQEGCWPVCLEGKDMQGVAEPGSGKTLAFLLPAAVKMTALMASMNSGSCLWTLIIAPTRELVSQIAVDCRPMYKLFGLRTAFIFGGVEKERQIESLQGNPHIVIGTPGRLLELVNDGHVNLGSVQYVALDEADKLLSPGMLEQCEEIRSHLPKKGSDRPQVVFFSATMPESVSGAAKAWMKKPTKLEFHPSAKSVSRTITQVVHVCAEHKKPGKLLKHLEQINEKCKDARQRPRILIFANTVKAVRFLETTLKEAEYKVAMLHGKRSQTEREQAMSNFKAGKSQVLVATDVAARGLHIRNLPYIVNYDFPSRIETYIHRVGRTGRLAAYGHAYSFFTRNLAKLTPDLIELLEHHEQVVDPNLVRLSEAFEMADKVMKEMEQAEEEDDSLEEIFTEDEEEMEEEVAQKEDPVSKEEDELLEHMASAVLKPGSTRKEDKKKKGRRHGLLKKRKG
ncbi:hypothetical protein BSKO_04825 [Bryopsis sp. KO-2023]|nr:hypothetical protein BSKO_04825 [Bryopsis sp. KO-2023]